MTRPDFDVSLLAGEWREVAGSAATELEDALAAEVSPSHPLHPLEVQATAVRRHLKDVVFWVPPMRQWALVHLTGHREADPRWPSVSLHDDWNNLVADLAP